MFIDKVSWNPKAILLNKIVR